MLLAPVVQDRKGEHVHLATICEQGFIRARIDGLVAISMKPLPSIKRKT